jgi:hypothetical protein
MALTLISTHTASASATLDITSGIDSTYDSYEFHFVNMHPATDDDVQVSSSKSTQRVVGLQRTMTSTYFGLTTTKLTDTNLAYHVGCKTKRKERRINNSKKHWQR